MDKDGYPGNQHDMIIVFMWIFMGMIVMLVVVDMGGEYFFEEIDGQKSPNKCVNRKLALLYRFWKDMDERYRKHRSSSESYEEMEKIVRYVPKAVEYHPSRGYDKEN